MTPRDTELDLLLPGPNPAADLRFFIGKRANRKARGGALAYFAQEEAPQLVAPAKALFPRAGMLSSDHGHAQPDRHEAAVNGLDQYLKACRAPATPKRNPAQPVAGRKV